MKAIYILKLIALFVLLFNLKKSKAQNLFIPKELYNHNDYVGCYKALQQPNLSQPASILKLKCLVKLDSLNAAFLLAQKLYKTTVIDNDMELLADVYRTESVLDTALLLYQKAIKINTSQRAVAKQNIQKKIQQIYNFKEVSKIQGNIYITNLGTSINKSKNQYYPQLKYDTLLFYNDAQNTINERVKRYNTIEGTIKTVTILLKEKLENFKDIYIIGSSSKSDFVLLNVLHQSVNYYTLKLCKYNSQENSISEIANLNESLSKSLSNESSAYITNDGEQIVFSSNRKGGFGGFDIYVSKILPNGDYSEPRNLGNTINTDANEEFPVLSPDGKKLYFSSDGHTSIGGYDLFLSDWDSIQGTYVNIRNFGADVNTIKDNFNITLNSSGRTGYTSGIYKSADNYGDDDIYELTFNDVDANTIILIGQTTDNNVNAIEVTKQGNTDLIGSYKPNSNNGKFIAALAPGNYDFLFFLNDKEITRSVSIPNRPNLSEVNLDFKFK